MVCSVWLRISLTGEERGQQSDRVVKAAREDGTEKCAFMFWNRLLTPRNIEMDREVTAVAWRTCNTVTKLSRSEYDRPEKAVRYNEEMTLGRTDARTPCVYAPVYH